MLTTYTVLQTGPLPPPPTADLPSLPFLCSLVNTFKADINLQDGYGLTPLCLAAQNGLETMAEVLVCVLGADVNATDGSELRWTPMHHAVQYNHPRVVR